MVGFCTSFFFSSHLSRILPWIKKEVWWQSMACFGKPEEIMINFVQILLEFEQNVIANLCRNISS